VSLRCRQSRPNHWIDNKYNSKDDGIKIDKHESGAVTIALLPHLPKAKWNGEIQGQHFAGKPH